MRHALLVFLRALVFAAFGALLLVVVYVRVSSGAPFAVIPSTSMEPVLRPGDLVLLTSVKAQALHLGDVVAVRVPAATQQAFSLPPEIVHRIVRVFHRGGVLEFPTKGGRNAGPDPFVTPERDVVGRVRAVYHDIGWPILFLASRWGLIFLVVVGSVLLLVKVRSGDGGPTPRGDETGSSAGGVSSRGPCSPDPVGGPSFCRRVAARPSASPCGDRRIW